MYYVYKYIEPENDNCVYVGKTKNLSNRHGEHLTNKKEEWCTTKLKLEYIEVEDRYTTDYFEMYLINNLEPKYNKAGKGEIDTSNIVFELKNGIWKEYSKDIFLKEINSKKLNVSVRCEVNENRLEALKKINKKNMSPNITYQNGNLIIKYNYDVRKYFEDLIEGNIIGVDYNALKYNGGANIISWRIDSVVVRLSTLNHLKECLPYPEEEMFELNNIVNEVLKIIGFDSTWDKILNSLNS
ncbi:TPA: GIY-YIG nuclease family protein [Clostridioides difficile]|nr:GIY-YIG nuclease family protein [Clostridioides difficile]HBG1040863.1 GIY-YIG nuclease family protein [Clostridioides difficile]